MDTPSTPRAMIRVPVRIAGKLVSIRMEEPILDDIDRLARAQGMDRSRWIRHACHVQLALDLIAHGGAIPDEPNPEPETEVTITTSTVVAPVYEIPVPPEPVAWVQSSVPDSRANRWG